MNSSWHETDLAIGAQIAAELFDVLAAKTTDPPGVTRKAYGNGERIAHELISGVAAKAGAKAEYDAAGNLFLVMPGEDRSREILVGSHVDTVPHGGNFDGAAGVIAGIAAQAVFHAADRRPPFDLTVVALRAEESCWFPYSYVGSKTALGILDPAVPDSVKRIDTGKTLAEHMREAGFDPDAVKGGAHRVNSKRTIAYIEPHIEQAPILVLDNLPVGVVTGIRGSFRYRQAKCIGAYAHSGAMPREYRKDAVMATSDLIQGMDRFWDGMEAKSADLTVTFGELGTNPEHHGFSKVPGETHICVDIRSQEQETLSIAETRLHELVADIEKKRGVRFELGERTGSKPALMSGHLQEMLHAAAKRIGIEARTMASGAGHDASVFSLHGVPSAMLFIRNTDGSHNPDEAMALADFNAALAVLVEMLSQPASAWPSTT